MKQRKLAGGLSAGGGGGGLGSRLRTFDLYRKIPRDLTEATAVGGSISLVFVVFFVVLIYLEVSNFVAVREVTSIEIDHSEDGVFQVNFNLTLQHLGCEHVAVDLTNVIGRKREDVKDRTVHKYSLDGAFQGYADDDKADLEHLYEGTDRDKYGNTRHAIALDQNSFKSMVDRFEVMIVDFHAPWCVHCQHLSPIYEHAADLVKQRAPVEVDGHHKHSVALATVDCTVPAHRRICLDNHIQAFPTILVFRQSANNLVTGPRGRYYEQYTGPREAEPIANFAISVLKEVQEKDKDAIPQLHDGHDHDKDGVLDSKVSSRGCRIDGYLMVQRVPGQIIIRPKSSGHSFDTGLVNADHRISHLSFGNRKAAEVRKQVDANMDGAYAEKVGRPVVLAEGQDEIGFASQKPHATYYHYVKVVSTSRVPLRGHATHAYEYTINSNIFSDPDREPTVVFSYDLSPLKVQVKEEAKPWIEGFTSMAAILGGVYTCSVLFEAVFSGIIFTLTKKVD